MSPFHPTPLRPTPFLLLLCTMTAEETWHFLKAILSSLKDFHCHVYRCQNANVSWKNFLPILDPGVQPVRGLSCTTHPTWHPHSSFHLHKWEENPTTLGVCILPNPSICLNTIMGLPKVQIWPKKLSAQNSSRLGKWFWVRVCALHVWGPAVDKYNRLKLKHTQRNRASNMK